MTIIRDAVARLRLFYDPTREPLRRRVYTALLLVVPLAIGAGLLTGAAATSLVGLLPLLLAVPAVESARRQVTPTADPVLPPGSAL